MLTAAIVGAGISAASSIYGGIKSSQAARKAKRYLEQQQRENQDWYDRRYNEDSTQRADAQRIIQQTEDYLRKRNRAAAGTNAVIGGTEETVANEKAKGNEALANAVSTINAQGEARKDAVESQYLDTKKNLTQQQIGVENQRAQNIAQATAGVGQAVGSATSALIGAYGKDAGAAAVKGGTSTTNSTEETLKNSGVIFN